MRQAQKIDKFLQMVDNHRNGNLADFRKQLKSLSKKHILEFVEYCKDYEFMSIHQIVKHFSL